MADIELGENNDKQKSDSWILRSENLMSEKKWVCRITNQSQEDWNSLSDSGYFNSLVFNNPKMIDNNNKLNEINFFIGYDAKEDIAYRVCKYSLIKRSSVDVKVISLKLDELISKNLYTRGQ